ncbi:MAG: hypothetical protein D3919_03915 [Candidatus Electrothrix sp. AW5]|nr:hypothetical protein [Candidatus Electrothrix gigas]
MKTQKSIILTGIFILSFLLSLESAIAAFNLGKYLRERDPGPSIGKAVRTQYHKQYEVSIKNKCNKPIRVALHYKPITDGQSYTGAGLSEWDTKYWWTLNPGEKSFIETTRNGIVYFHAKSSSGTWGNKNHQWRINGKLENFFRVDMGDSYRAFTQNFTCN